MILFADLPHDPEGPDGPSDGESHPEGERPQGTPPPSPAELPSYPSRRGSRAERRATDKERQRQQSMEDEYGLPTYPRARRDYRRHSILDRLLVLIVALAAVLLIAYALTRADREPAPDDLLVQAVTASIDAEVSLATGSPRRARQFVRDEFGWSVGVPIFPEAELYGVGIGTLAPTIEVPTFFYRDQRGRRAVLFRLNYALLDQVPDHVRLRRADYERLAEDPAPTARRTAGRHVLFWRDRADIFVLVTDIPPDVMGHSIRISR